MPKSKITLLQRAEGGWATTIRYSRTALSNKSAVEEVLAVCEQLVKLANERIPTRIPEVSH